MTGMAARMAASRSAADMPMMALEVAQGWTRGLWRRERRSRQLSKHNLIRYSGLSGILGAHLLRLD